MMRSSARWVVLGSLLGLAACGGGGGGGSGTTANNPNIPPAPTTYALFQNQAGTMNAGSSLEAGPFTLPAGGAIDYTITNRSTTSPDHWDISIIPASELGYFENGQAFRAYGQHAMVSTQSDTVDVPAGTYTFGIVCRNAIESCQFSLDAAMTY